MTEPHADVSGSLHTVVATRVLRRDLSGSSSPVVVETATGPWFAKLRGAAQGIAPLIAELLVAELADALSLNVPRRALVELPADVPSDDVNDELRDLLDASVGINVGFALIDGARNLTRAEYERVPLEVAAAVLWLDMLVQNLDRSPANPNMMVRKGTYWLIDHGAALPMHHDWASVTEATPSKPYDVSGHLFGWTAPVLSTMHAQLVARMTRERIEQAVAVIPAEWLTPDGEPVDRRRAMYVAYLWKRRQWMHETLTPMTG